MTEDLKKLRSDLRESGWACFWGSTVTLDGSYTLDDLKDVIRLLEEGWVDEDNI